MYRDLLHPGPNTPSLVVPGAAITVPGASPSALTRVGWVPFGLGDSRYLTIGRPYLKHSRATGPSRR